MASDPLPSDERGGRDTEELDRLFLEFLERLEHGRDEGEGLVAGAGALGPRLAERIRVHRELAALSHDLGLGKARPARLGRFEVLRLVGSGGISRVYAAHDPRLGRTVALKVLDRKGMLDRSDRAWILNEGRSLARITHRNVARIHDVGEIDEDPYIAMELLPGPSLADVIAAWRAERDGSGSPADGRTLALAARYAPWSARIALLEALADALAHCHDHGILHRDVKPANVLFDADGEPRLIDFGLAHVEGADEDSRLGLTQALVGTAAYIAPEQVTSDATGADPRSDQFSLATLGYELFALENPFHRPSRHATLAAVEAADPPPLAARARALPPDLPRVIHHALAKAPEHRYADLAALASDLRAIRAHRPISVSAPSPRRALALWLRRHRRAALATGAVVLAVGGTAAFSWTTETLALRRSVLAELAGVHPESLDSLAEMERAGELLGALKLRARSHDAGWIRGRVPLEQRVQAVVHAWSRHLAELLAAEEARSTRTGLPLQDATYRRLMWQEERICPECPYNVEARSRGSVAFPEDVLARPHAFEQLGVFELSPAAPQEGSILPRPELVTVFVRASLAPHLVSGTYRLLAFDARTSEVAGELVFHVPEGWNPRIVLQMRPPDGELLRTSLEVQRARQELDGISEGLEVPRFRVMKRLVTEADFARFAAETGRASAGVTANGPTPASCEYDSALAFAAWAGGRLPTTHELRLARDQGLELSVEPGVSGELLLDLALGGDPSWLGYDKGKTILLPSRTMKVSAGEGMVPIGFRLVFSADDRDEYQRLSERSWPATKSR